MISLAEADRLIGRHLNCLPIEVPCPGAVRRGESSCEHVYGERDQPPFDRVAMDGIAIDSTAVRARRARRLHVQAMQAAGDDRR